MRKFRRIILVIIVLCFFIYFRNNEYFLLIGVLLVYTGIIAGFVKERRNIRIGKYVSVGKNTNNRGIFIFLLSIGILILIFGIFTNNEKHLIFGINNIVFTGMLFVILGLIRTQKSLFLLTDKTIQFENDYFDKDAEWEYEKLDKVVLGKKEILFVKGKESEKFEIEEDNEVYKAIQDFLLPKLENRLIIE